MTNVVPLTSKNVLIVDGLVLPKKSAKVEAVAMTTVDITWAPSTAFIRRVSTPLHDPKGGFFSFRKTSKSWLNAQSDANLN